MTGNDDQMQTIEAGLRDHILAWQAANPDKALDSAALQRAGSEYVAGQVLGGDWDPSAGDAPVAQNAVNTQETPRADEGQSASAVATTLEEGGPESAPDPASNSPESPSPGSAPDGSQSQTHVMRKGDTLWGISQQTGIPLEDIQAANPQITDPTKIPVGAVVNLPRERVPRANAGAASQSDGPNQIAGDQSEHQGNSGMTDSEAPQDAQGFLRDLQRIAARSPSLAAAIADRIMGPLVGEAQAAEPSSGTRGRKHASTNGAQNAQPGTWESITKNINLQEVGKLLDWLGEPDTGGGPYEAQNGDTWDSVARQANISVAALKSANPALHRRTYLPKGAKIIIPQVAPPLGTPPDDPSWNRVLPHGSVAVAPTQADSPSYVVRPGENLLTICVFQTKLDTDSTANWTVIPAQSGQRFHGKLDGL